MSILETVISGIVQGITEFLPISSSAHLVILHTFFGYKEAKVLEDVLLHFGTLLAVLIFFRRDIINLFKEKKKVLLIFVGSIPIVVAGFFFGKNIETLFSDTKAVGVALIVTSAWLLAADISLRLRREDKRSQALGVWHALVIGISQALAVIPGISRSGATISTGILLNRKRETSFRFSFLLSVPAILG